jgi:hypothetical protein
MTYIELLIALGLLVLAGTIEEASIRWTNLKEDELRCKYPGYKRIRKPWYQFW